VGGQAVTDNMHSDAVTDTIAYTESAYIS